MKLFGNKQEPQPEPAPTTPVSYKVYLVAEGTGEPKTYDNVKSCSVWPFGVYELRLTNDVVIYIAPGYWKEIKVVPSTAEGQATMPEEGDG